MAQDDLSGPRRDEDVAVDPDLGRTRQMPASTEEKSAQVDLAIRARKLKNYDEQNTLCDEARDLTRYARA